MNLHDVIRYLVRQNAPRDPLQTQQLLAAVDAHEQEYGRGPEVAPAALSGTPGAAAAGLEAEPFNVPHGDPGSETRSPEGYRDETAAPPPDEANVPAQVEDTTQAQAADAAAPAEERAQTEGEPGAEPAATSEPAPADRPVGAPGFTPTPVTPPADVAPPAPEERAQTEGETQAAAEERARTGGEPEPAEPVEDSQATIARLEAELAQLRGGPPPTP